VQQQAKLGAYTPPYVLIDIQEAQSAIRRIKEQLRADGVPVADEPNDDVQPAAFIPPSHLSPREQQNRNRMLDKVEAFWVKGVLEQFLYQIARLELGFEHAPAQVSHPWETVLQQANQPNQTIPAGKPVIAVFDNLLGEMLILGAPGAGKTTTLLELTRDLITRARSNEQYPIPVVFNLSTWATKRQPLKEWLAEELNQRYDVPKKLAQEWVAANTLLPLLDGLDEVAAEYRDACAEAINEYRKAAGFVPLAVCSRITDYEVLITKLRLQGAIVIQPLTKPQVDNYLKQIGRPLAAVRAALRDDAELWGLMENPLMLSIVALAYKDTSAVKLRASGTLDARRRRLFDDYIEAMFTRPGRSKGTAIYPQEQMLHQLSWLAGKMLEQKQTVYYIERMQSDWLPPRQRGGYLFRVRLLCGLVVGLCIGLVAGLLGGLGVGLGFGLVAGLGFGLVAGLGNRLEKIKVVETLPWSWSRYVLLNGLGFGLVAGLVAGLRFGLLVGLLGGLGVGLLIGLLGGLGVGPSGAELEVKAVSNQGIHRSAQSCLIFGLLGALGGGLFSGLFAELFDGLFSGLIFGLCSGLGGGLGVGLDIGGRAVLQHYTLRWLLYRNGSLPFRDLIPFLDYCAERIFLRKVGGGYIFVHRLLMEHFESLYTAQREETSQRV
jgi:hypothetical protein